MLTFALRPVRPYWTWLLIVALAMVVETVTSRSPPPTASLTMLAALGPSCTRLTRSGEPRLDRRHRAALTTLLQSSPEGVFVGGFKNLFNATLVNRDEMQGAIDARLYSFTDATGATFVAAAGFPSPNPLAPASECATTPGCTHLGAFSFIVRRVKVN